MQFARSKDIDLNVAMEHWQHACDASAYEACPLDESSEDEETHAAIGADVADGESESDEDEELSEVLAAHTEDTAYYWIAACARYKENKHLYDNCGLESIKRKAKQGNPAAIWKWKNEM